jgi:alpha-1,2-mannosyltransferase
MASVSIHCEVRRSSGVRKIRFSVPGAGLPVAIAAASAGLRLLMLWRQGGLFNDIEYDDGVHLGSSLLLAHGQVLYRNQVFLHPPGISLLLLPFSWAAAWLGQPAAFALTRLVTVGVSAAGAGLVTYVVGRSTSRLRAVVAGAFAVVFAPSMVAGSTLMLEPWLGLFGLLAVERFTRSSLRRVDVALAGCFLGYATVIKAWGVIPLAGVAIWLLCERRRSESLRLLTAAAATIAAVIGPFLVLGGDRLVADVVWTQLRRPPDGIQGLLARAANVLGLKSHLLVAIVLVGLAVLIWRAVHVPGVARLSAIVLAIAIPVFANAPSFFFHYGDFFTPWVALLIATQPALRWSPRVIPSMVVIALLYQSVGLLRRQQPADLNAAQLQRLAGRHACVVSDQASLLLLAGAFDRPGCPSWLDPRGAALTELRGREKADFYPSGFRRLPRWQGEYVALMSRADLLILTGDPCGHPEWTAATCQWVQAHFTRIAKVGHAGPGRVPVAIWQRR